VSKRVRGVVVVVILGLVAALVLGTVGPLPVAGAAGKQPPPPPKPAKPHGPKSGLNFDQWGPAATDDVVLKWDEQTLAEIRATKPAPTVVARHWPSSTPPSTTPGPPTTPPRSGPGWVGGSLRRPADERTADYKSKAISYAAYRTLLDLFPSRSADLVGFMTDLGYDPADTSVDTTTPQGVGNVAAQAVLDFRHDDGANQLGDRNGGAPYSDWTRYAPVNAWDTVNDPYRWQPLCVPTPPPAPPAVAAPSSGSPPPSGTGSPRSRSPRPTSSPRRCWTGPSCPTTPSSWSTSSPS
jgi:Domain of unknown function (DUF6851)